jgi:hypothetical protein
MSINSKRWQAEGRGYVEVPKVRRLGHSVPTDAHTVGTETNYSCYRPTVGFLFVPHNRDE